jgi:SAM-dependent methyltransferase
MTPAAMSFGLDHISDCDVRHKRVLEVGSVNVNGSLGDHIASLRPRLFERTDIVCGPGVSRVVDVCNLVREFGLGSFDLIVTTEMMEHVADWRAAAINMMEVLTPGGVLVLTTRAPGFPRHGYPGDFWRFTAEDLRVIFSALDIEELIEDRADEGAFMRARRPCHLATAYGPPRSFNPHEVQ